MKSFDNRREEISIWLAIIKNMCTPAGASTKEQKHDVFLCQVLKSADLPEKLAELLHYISTDKSLTQ